MIISITKAASFVHKIEPGEFYEGKRVIRIIKEYKVSNNLNGYIKMVDIEIED